MSSLDICHFCRDWKA